MPRGCQLPSRPPHRALTALGALVVAAIAPRIAGAQARTAAPTAAMLARDEAAARRARDAALAGIARERDAWDRVLDALARRGGRIRRLAASPTALAALADAFGAAPDALRDGLAQRGAYGGVVVGIVAPGYSARFNSPPQVIGATALAPVERTVVTPLRGSETGGGEFDAETALPILRRALPRVRACYERSLRSDPTLAGRLAVTLVIGVSGSVVGTAVTGELANASDATTCITATLRALAFPPPRGGPASITIPLVFSPN